jgi:hypothetical protein
MPNEYGFTSSSCPRCGAGQENNYEHDADCLINLPDHRELFVSTWVNGFNACHLLDGNALSAAESDMAEETAGCFIKGVSMARKRMAADPVMAERYRAAPMNVKAA